MNAGNDNDRDRESYIRWQEIALVQLGYTINLLLTFAGVTLSFALKILIEPHTPFPCRARFLFYAAMLSLSLSVLAALGANVTRALDLRDTRRAARARMKDGKDHDKFHDKADCYGRWTWRLFFTQVPTFLVGVVLLGLSLLLAYRA
jgi:hypothetical protein